MDDIPLCPDWWPRLLWWHIHHPHGPGDPGPIDRERFAKLDAHFSALAVEALSARLGDSRMTEQVGALVGTLASDPMPLRAGLADAR